MGRIDRTRKDPLIDPGHYLARFVRWYCHRMKKWGPKVYSCFQILDGVHAGVEVRRMYNVDQLITLPNGKQDFVSTPGQDITRDVVRLAGDNGDVVDLDQLVDLDFVIKVETVTKGRDGNKLHPSCQYSKVVDIQPKDYLRQLNKRSDEPGGDSGAG